MHGLKVNVLIMAKTKKKKKVTAGDLFGKLGKTGNSKAEPQTADDEFIEEPLEEFDEDAIDVTSDEGFSDSDLDINALLKKYMPDYQEEEAEEPEGTEEVPEKTSGGVLSRFRKKRDEELTEDEKLIDALDSAFTPVSDEDGDGDIDFSDIMSTLKKTQAEEIPEPGAETISEYDLDAWTEEAELPDGTDEGDEEAPQDDDAVLYDEEDPADDTYGEDELADYTDPDGEVDYFDEEFAEDEAADEAADEDPAERAEDDFELPAEEDLTLDAPELPEEFTAEKPKKKGFFGSLFGGKKKESVDEFADELEENDREYAGETPADIPQDELEAPDEAVLAAAEEQAQISVEERLDSMLTDEAAADAAEIPGWDESSAEEAPVGEPAENAESQDEEIDPTDINLMVAFGLDKKSDKAKQFGDRLEEKQHTKAKKVQLDRPEYVDKSQTGQIRSEYKAKQTSLWVRLVLCGILTLVLMIFENIEPITKLFTGSGKQFSGVFDPAVYPVVYVMVSLQIMLLACFCAYDQIFAGIKCLFRGNPRPESMTALLTLLGIVYSCIVARVIEIPEEPVMFNFVVALSALLTLVYALYNVRREMMNFRIVANKRPKHIVRRLLDEESECESKAFAEDEDVCDVMKIEKTDFIDGFFGRLNAPDPSANRFMIFAMSASAAIAVLFGLFTSFGDASAAQVCAAAFGSMMILVPLSVYITFSYPFYRANLAAKQYESAIIGEASLDEYSNASIISFDDKNVFPRI